MSMLFKTLLVLQLVELMSVCLSFVSYCCYELLLKISSKLICNIVCFNKLFLFDLSYYKIIMMLFKNNKQISKNLNQIKMIAAFSKNQFPDQTPQTNPELRGYSQLNHMNAYQKSFFYFHVSQKKTLSLYNIFSSLPLSFCQLLAKLTADPKTVLASDQLYLPKILSNGVPVYQAVRLGALARISQSLQSILIAGALLSTYPLIMLAGMLAHYPIYYKAAVSKSMLNVITKMQLNPSKQEIVYQKVNVFGSIRTYTAKINDLEHLSKVQFENKNLIFIRSTKSLINQQMIFRKKSTGQLLLFDSQGIWHDEGINHELLK